MEPVILSEKPCQGLLDVPRIMASLQAHQIPPCEHVDVSSGTHSRVVQVADVPRVLELRITPEAVKASISCPQAEITTVRGLVRSWFSLDLEISTLSRDLGHDPVLTGLLERRPHLRPLGHPDGFEAAITTVLGQQVSLAAMRQFSHRLVQACSPQSVPAPGTGEFAVFPSPQDILGVDVTELRAHVGLTNARARTVAATAALFADGFILAPGADRRHCRESLAAVPGIGPWTVEYLALRVLGDLDAFPASDAVLRRALGGINAAAATALAERWRPYRGLVTTHLWAADREGQAPFASSGSQ